MAGNIKWCIVYIVVNLVCLFYAVFYSGSVVESTIVNGSVGVQIQGGVDSDMM